MDWICSRVPAVELIYCIAGKAHLLSQKLGRVPDTPNHTEAARVGDSSSKLRTGCNVHPCERM